MFSCCRHAHFSYEKEMRFFTQTSWVYKLLHAHVMVCIINANLPNLVASPRFNTERSGVLFPAHRIQQVSQSSCESLEAPPTCIIAHL